MKLDKWSIIGMATMAVGFVSTVISNKKQEHDINSAAEKAVQEAIKNLTKNTTDSN